jgi:hypothetical protein
MRNKHTARPLTRPSSTSSALAEFHALAGHAGPAGGCQKCAGQQRRQRQTASALRTHQRQAREQVDTILRKAVSS